jgi:hypothetical protein
MNKLRKAKEIIRKNIECGDCGLFNHHNIIYDPTHNIYDKNGLIINVCYEYSYFEVIGLSDEEFGKLEDYYNNLIWED